MPDYNYDPHRVTLGDDHDQNTATDLGGYPLDLQPQGDWPGTTASQRSASFDTAKMRDVAQWIEDQVNSLEQVPSHLNQVASKANFGPNTWYEANHLGDASSQVLTAVTQYSQEILANLREAATSIRAAADTYDGGETANRQSVGNQQRALDSTAPDTQSPPY